MKKAKKFKIIYVYEPVHKVWVDVVMYDWNKYVKTVQKYIKDFNYQLPEKSIVEGKNTMVGMGSAIIYLKYKSVPTLAHELQHYVLQVLKNRGYYHCEDSEEIFCYELEYFISEIIKKW